MSKVLFLFFLSFSTVAPNQTMTENLIRSTLEFATLLQDSSFTNVRIFCSTDIQDSDKFVEEMISLIMFSRLLLVSFVFVR